MRSSTGNLGARIAAVVNGVLVFAVPAGFMVFVLVSPSGGAWPDELAAHRPTRGQMVLESVQFGLVFAVLAALAAWRTWVHALRYQSGTSHGWQGVGEAAAVGFVGAVLYLAQGIVTRPSEAPPYVIFYGSAAAILGAVVGFVLRLSATIVLRLSKSVAA